MTGGRPGGPMPGELDAGGAGGLVTFLRTDIEGLTRLWQTRGDQTGPALDLHDGVLARAIERNGGRVERNEGDSFFALFPRPTMAVAAAVEIQRELEALPWPTGIRTRVRVGIHTGEAGRLGANGRLDTRGLEANICGRLSDLARGGQVLLTLHTALFAKRALPAGAVLRDRGWRVLRDVAEPQRIFELVVADGVPTDGGVESVPLLTHTQDDVDRRLAELSRKLRTVATNLHEFQEMREYRLLLGGGDEPGEHLAGETRARVVPAFQAMRRLSLQLGDLEALVERATRLRGAAGRLSAERVDELAGMLFGPSLELLTGRIPIEARRMDEDPEAYLRITPDDLLRALENAFEFARDVVLDVKRVLGRVQPRLDHAAVEAGALESRANALGEPGLAEELTHARRSIEALLEQARRDPLGMVDGAERAVQPFLDDVRLRFGEVQRRRDAIPGDMRRARQLLADIEALHTTSEREYRWACEMIERPQDLVAPPDPSLLHGATGGLAPRLARIDGLAESGSWRSARQHLDDWLREAERTLGEGRRALAANRAPRERRERLRRLLAERPAPGTDPELDALAERARALLWAAPTDLAAADRAIAAYLARLHGQTHNPFPP